MCDNDDDCNGACDGISDSGCLGAISPSACDVECDLAAGCGLQASVQSVVLLLMGRDFGSGFVYGVAGNGGDDADTAAFDARMRDLYEYLQDIYGDSVAIRTWFDNEFTNTRGFDCSAAYIEKSTESLIDQLAQGTLSFNIDTDYLSACAIPAFTEALTLLNDTTMAAGQLIAAQARVAARAD